MIKIDLENGRVCTESNGVEESYPLDSSEAFRIVSQAWLRCGWDTKHVYSFTWMGRPIIQLPEDIVRLQEVIYELKPDVIVETGIAHGGSLVFHASLCKAMGHGRVIGVDVEIRPHNRAAMESHELTDELITMIEGDSTDPVIVARVKSLIQPGERVLVLLDSCHTREHVQRELDAYHDLVDEGSYIVACDGIMAGLQGAPRSAPDWATNNPTSAAGDFVLAHPEFEIQTPTFRFNEGKVRDPVTYWPSAWIRRVARTGLPQEPGAVRSASS
ncbi:MAG: hydroxylase [Planctomycetes bacterium]|nr:hydroxylase [Planctomycetota bacterium]